MKNKIILTLNILLTLCFAEFASPSVFKKPSLINQQLINAIENNDLESVKAKIRDGANINTFDKDGYSALHTALINNYSDISNFLIKQGADIKAKTKFGETSLHLVRDTEITKLLIKNGLDVNAKDYEYEMTPIFSHEIDIAKLLLEAGADINVKSKSLNTPLIWYTYSNYIDGVIFLLKNGADINAVNIDGSTALKIATHFHHEEIMKILKDHSTNNPNKDNARNNQQTKH